MKAVFLDYASLAPNDLDFSILKFLSLDITYHDVTSPEQTTERIKGVDIILTNKVVLDDSLLKANKSIRLIIILATGTNNVDLDAARELGIPVSNVRGYSTESVAQHTMAMMLALKTRLLDYHHSVNSGEWSDSPFFCMLDHQSQEIQGTTLGIIGYGAIGQRVAELSRAFGMNVLVAKSLVGSVEGDNTERLPLDQVLAESDVLSIHCPLSPLTKDLIGESEINKMKKGSMIINTARGGIVHEAALLEGLRGGKLAGAALDVLAIEPPDDNHILIKERRPNLIITPHCGWSSLQSRQAMIDQVVDILQSFNNGNVINQVNAV